jgi:transcriptional regulator with XRE-family HTH domain
MPPTAWRERARHLLRALVDASNQSEIARRIGTRQSSISSWLSEARNLKRENAEAICRVAGLPPAYLEDATGPLDPAEWKRERSGVRNSPAHSVVRRVIEDHHITGEEAARLRRDRRERGA